jgi:triacylglycerol esterase/lipase EstA (alpha/beta hydrolase family)
VRQATIVALPGDGTGDLDVQADALGRAADAALTAGAPSVDVVGYSAGGIVARIWARNHGGASSARRIVTLGSPHHGTDLAAVAGLLLPGQCPPACRQLAPGSDVMVDLNSGDETPTGPEWVSIWTEQDQVVVPPETARLGGAHNVPVQRICPGRAVDHGQLPTDAVVDALVLRALAAAPFATPKAADCSSLAGQG